MSHDDLPQRCQWVPIERTETSFNIRKKSFTIKETQFPLTLSYACTIHKVQDLCLQQVVVYLIFISKNHSCKVRRMWL